MLTAKIILPEYLLYKTFYTTFQGNISLKISSLNKAQFHTQTSRADDESNPLHSQSEPRLASWHHVNFYNYSVWIHTSICPVCTNHTFPHLTYLPTYLTVLLVSITNTHHWHLYCAVSGNIYRTYYAYPAHIHHSHQSCLHPKLTTSLLITTTHTHHSHLHNHRH